MRTAHRRGICTLALVLAGTLVAPAQDATPEFHFQSAAARTLLHEARNAHGLQAPRPVALIGTVVRGEMTDQVLIVIDVAGRYKRAGAMIQGSGASQRVTRMATHVLDGDTYRKVPHGSPEIAAIAAPRLEREFNRMSVTVLLRPPRGREMTVRAGEPVEFNGEPANPLHVTAGGEVVCTLFVRRGDATVAGWSMSAETSAGFMAQVVVVESATHADGMRLPTVLRERTGDAYGSVTTFTTFLTGEAALQEFARDE